MYGLLSLYSAHAWCAGVCAGTACCAVATLSMAALVRAAVSICTRYKYSVSLSHYLTVSVLLSTVSQYLVLQYMYLISTCNYKYMS